MDNATLTLLLVLAALQVADFFTTFGFLRKGGVELNPFVRKVIESAGPAGFLALKLAAGAVVMYFASQGALPVEALEFFCLCYVGLVVNNLLLIKRLSGAPDHDKQG